MCVILSSDAIWLVQSQHALKAGGWKVESLRAQQTLSFEGLYRWLEAQAARGENKNLYDPATKRLLKRYKLPFKKFIVPPDPTNVSTRCSLTSAGPQSVLSLDTHAPRPFCMRDSCSSTSRQREG